MIIYFVDQRARTRAAAQWQRIHDRGEPTTLAEFRDRLPRVPDNENMTPALLAVGKLLEKRCADDSAKALNAAFNNRVFVNFNAQPSAEQRAAIKAYLDTRSTERESIYQALNRPLGQLSMDENRVIQLRDVLDILSWDMVVRLNESSIESREIALNRLLRLEKCIGCPSHLLAALIRASMIERSNEAILSILNRQPLPETTLVQVATIVNENAWDEDLFWAICGERAYFHDLMATRLGSDPRRFLPIVNSQAKANTLELYSNLIDALHPIGPRTITALPAFNQDSGVFNRLSLLTGIMTPALSNQILTTLPKLGTRRALSAVLACERYRLAEGKWPESLDVLVPRFLSSVPHNISNDQPVEFERNDEGIWVYCRTESATGRNRAVQKHACRLLNPELRAP